MKRILWLIGLFLAGAFGARADGFIIIHEPYPSPMPSPPPWRPVPPPYRPYVFAPLEVAYHQVTARLKDQIAVTTVDQEFYNPNDRQLEGTYIFPVPTGGQINKFTMEIGGKEVEAELMAADKARRLYEDIVRKMKDPALLEYAGRDVFKVRIFPIEPRSKKRVKLSYTQVLKSDSGLISYVYPLNTEKFSAKPIPTVSLKIELEASQPIKSLYSPSHIVEISRHGETRATVGFESRNVKPATDFQLLYSLERGEVGLNLMTHKTGAEDGYFLLLAAPAFQLQRNQVVLKDVAFVLDTSGSMAGHKLAQAKKALQFCVENLNDGDRFEIIRFSTETEPVFNKLVEADSANRRRAQDFIKDLRAIGGTAIDDALQKALELRPSQSGRPYLVIFLTDGRPTIGNTDEDQILAHVKRLQFGSAEGGNTRIFCFGIGYDVNTHLLDKIAEATRAVSQYVLPEEDLEVKLSNFYTKIKEPVLTALKLSFPDHVRATKLYPAPLPDLFKGEQLIVAGRYSGDAAGKMVLEGTANGVPKHFAFEAHFPERASDHEFIPRLWATRRIGYLLDEIRLHGENKELKEEVTELARRYAVVTPYTAYLILEDEAQRNVPVAERSVDAFGLAPGPGQPGGYPHGGDVRLGDGSVIQRSAVAFNMLQHERAGPDALAAARSSQALKSASASAEAIAQGSFELNQSPALREAGIVPYARGLTGGGGVGGLAVPAGATVAAAPSQPAGPAAPRPAQAQQFVGGRSFYQNGKQWIDATVQKFPKAKRVRIQFNSDDYFKLASQDKRVLPWLALGQNVQFVLDQTIYEIYE